MSMYGAMTSKFVTQWWAWSAVGAAYVHVCWCVHVATRFPQRNRRTGNICTLLSSIIIELIACEIFEALGDDNVNVCVVAYSVNKFGVVHVVVAVNGELECVRTCCAASSSIG